MIEIITKHWAEILLGISTVLGGLAILAKVTPGKWDDRAVKAAQRVLSAFRGGRVK